jgi:L-malate glycosyltransferase
MSEPRRHLGAGAALSVVVQGGPLLAAGVLSIVIARTIGPSGNGRFALLVTLTGIAALVFSLGLSAGITHEVSRGRWSVARAARAAYGMGLSLGLVGSLAALGVFLLLHHSVFHGIRTELAALALASLPPVLAYQFADSILLARERYESYAALELSHSATLLVVGVVLVIPFGLTGAVVSLPAAGLVGAVVGAILLSREIVRDSVRDAGRSLWRAMTFGLQTWGANLLQQVNYRFDVLILGGFATTRDVGVYSVALTLTGIAWVLPQSLQTVLFPRTASLDEAALTGELQVTESDAALAKAVRHSVLLTAPAGLLVVLLLVVGVPRNDRARLRPAPGRAPARRREGALLGAGRARPPALLAVCRRHRDPPHACALLRADLRLRRMGGRGRLQRVVRRNRVAHVPLLPARHPDRVRGGLRAAARGGRRLPRALPAGACLEAGALSERTVLVLPAWYPTARQPLAGPFVRDHARAAAAYGHRMVVLVDEGPDASVATARISQERDGDLRVIRLSYRPRTGRMVYLPTVLRLARRLAREGTPVDILHAHIHWMGWPAALAGLLLRRPFIVTENSTEWPTRTITRGALRRARIAFDRAAFVCPVNERLQRAIQAYGIDAQFRIVPNTVDEKQFQPSERRQTARPTRLVNVSIHVPRKGLDVLLSAFATVVDQGSALELELVGDGPQTPDLRRFAAELGIADRVTFSGSARPEQVAEALGRSDIFVFPSFDENMPLAVLEALCCGLPVVATDVGGIPEAVSEDDGLLVPAGNAAALAAALATVVEHYEDFDRLDIARRAALRWSFEAVGRSWDEIYRSL